MPEFLPEKFRYCCQECNEFGYIDRRNVNKREFNSEGYQKTSDSNTSTPIDVTDNEKINTPKNEIKGGLFGWICPKCGRCYSPYNNTGGDWVTWKVTC